MSGSKGFVQYPAPAGTYKVSLKNRVAWQGAPVVRLQISVGNRSTEGEKLAALCEWAAVRFPHVVLVVSDTLQRFNVMHEGGLSEAAARISTKAAGDTWLERHADVLDRMPSMSILRWDDALAKPATRIALDRLTVLYGADAGFQSAIDTTIAAFCERRQSRHAGASITTARDFEVFARAFLLEELAVFSWLCARPGVDAYAGSWLSTIFQDLRNLNGVFFDAFRRDWLQVDYTKNGAFIGPRSLPLTVRVA